ncbi:Arc family DNA-binding protein [Cereibacter johrii]|uniref:Arc family DNA-binding protein n=1 Tax=Cereibacter johrii TaxID=445629 RepID=UPI003CE7F14E
MAQKSDSRELDKVIVRLPDGMRDRIKTAAEANNRSMNAEIVATLEEKYPAPTAFDFASIGHFLEFIEAANDEAEFGARLRAANDALLEHEQFARFQIREMEDPEYPGERALYISTRRD